MKRRIVFNVILVFLLSLVVFNASAQSQDVVRFSGFINYYNRTATTRVAPGMVVMGFGQFPKPTPVKMASRQADEEFLGVTIGGRKAYEMGSYENFFLVQVPTDLAPGSKATVILTVRDGGQLVNYDLGMISVEARSIGFYSEPDSQGQWFGLASNNGEYLPIREGRTAKLVNDCVCFDLNLWGTGAGSSNPFLSTGQIGKGEALLVGSTVDIDIDGKPLENVFLGAFAAPGFIGLDQWNLHIPATAAPSGWHVINVRIDLVLVGRIKVLFP